MAAVTRPTQSARWILGRTSLRPRLAMVLGSGFQSVAESLKESDALPYARIPGFPVPTAGGHQGVARLGRLGGTEVILLCGRSHYYEGHPLETVTFPIRVVAAMGINSILLTNAAGGIAPRLRTGDFMRLTDHINFMGGSPLRGTGPGNHGFVDLTQAYDPGLATLLCHAARRARVKLKAGVYLAVSGPNYETPAEIRAFKRLGADAVGMSTVPEVIVARQLGLRVAALSLITNLAAGRAAGTIDHGEVLESGKAAAERASILLTAFAGGWRVS